MSPAGLLGSANRLQAQREAVEAVAREFIYNQRVQEEVFPIHVVGLFQKLA
tara:strand:+ start:5810 stop:5962 length:153 start_codon:yes stop_codon:yes gene_type:complete